MNETVLLANCHVYVEVLDLVLTWHVPSFKIAKPVLWSHIAGVSRSRTLQVASCTQPCMAIPRRNPRAERQTPEKLPCYARPHHIHVTQVWLEEPLTVLMCEPHHSPLIHSFLDGGWAVNSTGPSDSLWWSHPPLATLPQPQAPRFSETLSIQSSVTSMYFSHNMSLCWNVPGW